MDPSFNYRCRRAARESGGDWTPSHRWTNICCFEAPPPWLTAIAGSEQTKGAVCSTSRQPLAFSLAGVGYILLTGQRLSSSIVYALKVSFVNQKLFDLDGQVAVIVGGTGVLGGAMAAALIDAGAACVLLGRNQDRGQQAAQRLQTSGGKCLYLPADAMEVESLAAARARINRTLGPVNILINATGGNHPDATLPPGADFCELPLAAWDRVFALNLTGGVLLPTQVFGADLLKQRRGSVINIASMAGMTPLTRVVAYSAAKAAVINLTQFLATHWAEQGVRVNAISPGFFPAEQNRALLYDKDGNYTSRGQQIIDHTPMRRFGNPQELAGATVWLASEAAASFVTGQNIVVDGGFSATTI